MFYFQYYEEDLRRLGSPIPITSGSSNVGKDGKGKRKTEPRVKGSLSQVKDEKKKTKKPPRSHQGEIKVSAGDSSRPGSAKLVRPSGTPRALDSGPNSNLLISQDKSNRAEAAAELKEDEEEGEKDQGETKEGEDEGEMDPESLELSAKENGEFQHKSSEDGKGDQDVVVKSDGKNKRKLKTPQKIKKIEMKEDDDEVEEDGGKIKRSSKASKTKKKGLKDKESSPKMTEKIVANDHEDVGKMPPLVRNIKELLKKVEEEDGDENRNKK